MSSTKIAIVLELTQREARGLQRLTMEAVEWGPSGKFGEDIRDINLALVRVMGVDELPVGVLHADGTIGRPNERTWK